MRHTFRVRPHAQFRVLDIYGRPLPAQHLEIHERGGKTARRAGADAQVLHVGVVSGARVKTSDGKRIIFGNFEFMRPNRSDPDEASGTHAAYDSKNDVFDDEHQWIQVLPDPDDTSDV